MPHSNPMSKFPDLRPRRPGVEQDNVSLMIHGRAGLGPPERYSVQTEAIIASPGPCCYDVYQKLVPAVLTSLRTPLIPAILFAGSAAFQVVAPNRIESACRGPARSHALQGGALQRP